MLDSLLLTTYPHECMEVFVVDGMSTDGTREVVLTFKERHPFIQLLDNPKQIVPTALNIGIARSSGDIILRMDAHTIYPKEYVSRCVDYLFRYDVDNVGGVWVTMPGGPGIVAAAIAAALSSPFGAGDARFRIGAKAPQYVDTVPFGCYRRELFDRIGFFDEDLIRSQDSEFNFRIIKNGGKILLVPDIFSYYYARKNIPALFVQYFQYGYFKPLIAKKLSRVFTLRQLVPSLCIALFFGLFAAGFFLPVFFGVLAALVALYVIVNGVFSCLSARKYGWRLIGALPLIFAMLHATYGVAYAKGAVDFFLLNKKYRDGLRRIPFVHLSI